MEQSFQRNITNNIHGFVGDTFQDCEARFFQDASFACRHSNQLQAEFYAFSDKKQNKQPCLTAVPNQKELLWTPVCAWKVCQHGNRGIVLQKRFSQSEETSRAQVAFVIRYLFPLITCHLMWLTTFPATVCGSFPARLYVAEYYEAVIRMIIQGRSPQVRRLMGGVRPLGPGFSFLS